MARLHYHMARLHYHVESRAVDCDGPLDRFYTIDMPEQFFGTEESDGFDDEYAFNQTVLGHVVNLNPMHIGRLQVIRFEEDDTLRFSWGEVTEEGHLNVEATGCREDGCDMGSSQRDHYAEAAGY